jgi:1-acyl-sn-glycerol-3-phosphate acyltransferase
MRAFWRAARSLFFLAVYFLYLVATGTFQRFVIWPLTAIAKARRNAIVGGWFRFMANSTIGLARVVAGVKLDVRARVPPGSCVAVMNHQSLLDIPIAYSQVGPPYPLIPTRASYARGIPLVSLLVRLGRLPLIQQKKETRRQDILAIAAGIESVLKGELSMLIFPEGHRTRDGEIGPFMKAGLRSILTRAQRPVFLVVVDGLWRARSTAESLFHFAGQRGVVTVSGPFPAPQEEEVDAFIDELHARMCAELDAIRGRVPADQGRAVIAK